jgi:predicted dehydrogenase
VRPLAVGVIGIGALGRHHTRILSTLPGARLVGIHDRRREVGEAVAAEFGSRHFEAPEPLLAECDAVVLAVPTVDHASLGTEILGRGLHLMVEKPIAGSLEEADALLAARGDRVLAVGHVEFFNPAVQALLDLGQPPRFVESQRLGVFSPRSLDVDVVLDLMIHDLQILHALDPSEVTEVRATGIAVLSGRVDIANARVALASGAVANLTASRVSAERARKLRLFLPSAYYSLDYTLQEIKGYRLVAGDEGRRIESADLDVEKAEPLRRELEAFVAACRGEAGGRYVDGAAARRALATALEVDRAMGTPVLESRGS